MRIKKEALPPRDAILKQLSHYCNKEVIECSPLFSFYISMDQVGGSC